MSNKTVRNLLVGLAIMLAIMLGTLCTTWYFFAGPGADFVCPPKPRMQAVLAISSADDSSGIIIFNTDPGVADGLEEFGQIYGRGPGEFALYVDTRFDLDKVLAYLEAGDECYQGEDLYIPGVVAFDLNAPTPTPGTTVISTGIARYMMPMDDRYYAVPACSYWADGVQWLVPCSIPCLPCPQAKLVGIRNSSEALRVIFFDAPLDIASQFTELGRLFHTTSGWFELYVDVRYDFPEVLAYLQSLRSVPQGHATPASTPTATPELDANGWIEWLTSQWHFAPDLDDWLLIDWSDTMTVTDALSQTIVIQGPATVRFGEGEGQ